MPKFEIYLGYFVFDKALFQFQMNNSSKLRKFAYANLTMRIAVANKSKVLIWTTASGEDNTHCWKISKTKTFDITKLCLCGLILNIYLSFPSGLQCPHFPFTLAKVSTLQCIANLHHSSVIRISTFSIIIIWFFFINLFYPLVMKKNIVYTFTYYMCFKLWKAF